MNKKRVPIQAWVVVCKSGKPHFAKGMFAERRISYARSWLRLVDQNWRNGNHKCGPHRIVTLVERRGRDH